MAFVFGPAGNRNYLEVFTRFELAQQCLRETPKLKFTIRINGLELLELAKNTGRGLWINPLA